ncbi:MAG: hypothetical protein A2X25_03625 [Chloroflexi bacterium GWB2_49_20]|nr:MAG: hypothetical protein A2X25_03625 [Chloroflexi bacterium GWB2_49_20]OGN76677.1 MAG: hypothetical protein A2X26_10715 [Chloroflexi bacterium GWC2_49_37]OGN83637.1 MAG: hypothetical protein A2X27_01370 [Chloroflexi bacterium GWD2_49_16]
MNTPHRSLRINIGFLIGQPIGTSRDFNFEYPSVQLGEDLNLHDFIGVAVFNRTPQGLFLQADFLGSLALECVRCLDLSDHRLKMEFSELYAFDYRSISESGLLVPESGYIDLEPLLREYTLLEIPISPICKTDCKGLCRECGQNLNEKDCRHNQTDSDSPFSSLKSFNKDQSG